MIMGQPSISAPKPTSRVAAFVLGVLTTLLAVALAAPSGVAQRAKSGEDQLTTGANAPDQARRTAIRFLTTNDYPPFNYLDEEGVLTGFNVDLARAICLDMSVRCEINIRPWEEMVPLLARHQTDAVIAGHMVSRRALSAVDFTDRYFYTPGRFAGRRNAPALDISPDGLDGRRIGVAKGTTHEAYLQTFFLDSTILRFETQDLARDALSSGKVDLVFDDGISLVLWINGEVSKGCCELKGGPYLEPKYFGDGIAIAVGKQERQLRADLNASLKRLKARGRFEELVLRYFPYRVF
jgi:polar amino acid transport system substrate-binding protein